MASDSRRVHAREHDSDDAAFQYVLNWAYGHRIEVMPGDLDAADFPRVRRDGYDPEMVHAFLAVQVKESMERMLAKIHALLAENDKLNDLLHGRGILAAPVAGEDGLIQATLAESAAQRTRDQIIRDTLAYCATITADAQADHDAAVQARRAAEMIEQQAREKAGAAAAAARAASPPPGARTREEFAADLADASARAASAETLAREFSPLTLVRAFAETVVTALARLEQPPQTGGDTPDHYDQPA